jgi:hypothetical protein
MVKSCRMVFVFIGLISLSLLSGIVLTEPALAQSFQSTPITLKASEIMPKEWLKGPNYTVKETITNDGVVSTYHLDTNYGPVVVESTVLLLKRIHELIALHKMEQLQRKERQRVLSPLQRAWSKTQQERLPRLEVVSVSFSAGSVIRCKVMIPTRQVQHNQPWGRHQVNVNLPTNSGLIPTHRTPLSRRHWIQLPGQRPVAASR